MFIGDGGSENGVEYSDRNVEKFDGRVRYSAGWKGWTKERKEFSCSLENGFAPIQSWI